MKTTWTFLLTGGMSALALTGAFAAGQPTIVNNLTGNLHISQQVPSCGGPVNVDSSVTGGELVIAPSEGTIGPGGRTFTLVSANIFFAPFKVDGRGCGPDQNYTEVDVQLVGSVSFTAPGEGPSFQFSIPQDAFAYLQTSIVNGLLDRGFKKPSQPVTGIIDLARGAFQMHVEAVSRLRFSDGSFGDGTQTVDVAGRLVFPDADGDGVPDRIDNCRFTPNPPVNGVQPVVPTPVITPPPHVTLHSCADHRIGVASAVDVCDGRPVRVTNDAPDTFAPGDNRVTWTGDDGFHRPVNALQIVTIVDTTLPTVACVGTPPPAGSFQVLASDDCSTPTIRLGTFTLANNETIMIQVVGRPGVHLVNDVRGSIRHFLVGPGENAITATDAAGNVAVAMCR